ncbi:helix-turn-helix domain-containing protein [Flavobacterium sp. SM15]|uniref:helix-turn-helix transcriptional regulator n=1 Tax=Flavobacterium sp. SM15 TaxID=2908005 RepID=UPI001EDBF44D|nr:helix-turn-helix domain-containing protein [Flavobacterium sp. SM15]MCG2609986.1 helix-turn-helix domain-containing protein [Flavobacterium sp. SM15]
MKEKIQYYLTNLFSELENSISNKVENSVERALSKHDFSSTSTNSSLLTTDELAKHLSVSKSHINKLRKKHKTFPVIKIDGAVRFKISEVETFFHNLNDK